MRPSYHKCLACQKNWITWQFAICTECEKKYGSSSLEWEKNGAGWLRELWNMEQRERRRIKKQKFYEVPLVEYDFEYQEDE